ncbi:hypothetical protein [Brevundimonas sp.]|uniref:hypothetical protein n=1 Tax=Brevundimonas sp. TaxID=1871086 RepID=UPI003F70BC04
MKTVEELRREAARCRRLSEGMGNRDLAGKLLVLAYEFEAAADDRDRAEGETFSSKAREK